MAAISSLILGKSSPNCLLSMIFIATFKKFLFMFELFMKYFSYLEASLDVGGNLHLGKSSSSNRVMKLIQSIKDCMARVL